MSKEGWPNYLTQQLDALRPAANVADPDWQAYGYVTYVDPAGQLRVAAAVVGSQVRDDDAWYASAAEELLGVAKDWRSRLAEDPDGRMWVLVTGGRQRNGRVGAYYAHPGQQARRWDLRAEPSSVLRQVWPELRLAPDLARQ